MIVGRQNVLILGPIGIGKTALVRSATRDLPKVIWVSSVAPLKAALQEIVQGLLKAGQLDAGQAAGLLRLPGPALSRSLAGPVRDCILVLDRLDQVTPSMAPALESITAECVTVGLVTEIPSSSKLTRFWWRFQKKITLQPLSPEDSKQLFWSRLPEQTGLNRKAWDRVIPAKSSGNPMAVLALAEQAQTAPSPSDLQHPAGRREVDLTPGLLLVGAGIIAARFIALGLNDVDTYILAGVGGAFFVVARYFIYRLLRQRSA